MHRLGISPLQSEKRSLNLGSADVPPVQAQAQASVSQSQLKRGFWKGVCFFLCMNFLAVAYTSKLETLNLNGHNKKPGVLCSFLGVGFTWLHDPRVSHFVVKLDPLHLHCHLQRFLHAGFRTNEIPAHLCMNFWEPAKAWS